MEQRIFMGIYPGGLVFADRSRERDGDYARLGFMPWDTLELRLEHDCPAALASEIGSTAAGYLKRVGETERLDTGGGSCVVLGSAILKAQRERERRVLDRKHDFHPGAPDDLKAFATWFVTRFLVEGICDPMYVVNVSALELNRGDGKNTFRRGLGIRDTETKVDRLADRLMTSYGANYGERPAADRIEIKRAIRDLCKRRRGLICACCNGSDAGRQWWNRDDGYGLCKSCVAICSRGEGSESPFDTWQRVYRSYGIRGIHYDLAESESDDA